MKKLTFIISVFMIVLVGFSQKSNIKNAKPFSLEISTTRNSNKPNSYFVKIDVINNVFYPKIIKYWCITTTASDVNSMMIMIINNGDIFYYPELIRCGMIKKLIFKRKNISTGYEIDFEKTHRDVDFNAKKQINDTYGLYSIQAIWYLPKDTIYSNIIELEYQKEK